MVIIEWKLLSLEVGSKTDKQNMVTVHGIWRNGMSAFVNGTIVNGIYLYSNLLPS